MGGGLCTHPCPWTSAPNTRSWECVHARTDALSTWGTRCCPGRALGRGAVDVHGGLWAEPRVGADRTDVSRGDSGPVPMKHPCPPETSSSVELRSEPGAWPPGEAQAARWCLSTTCRGWRRKRGPGKAFPDGAALSLGPPPGVGCFGGPLCSHSAVCPVWGGEARRPEDRPPSHGAHLTQLARHQPCLACEAAVHEDSDRAGDLEGQPPPPSRWRESGAPVASGRDGSWDGSGPRGGG